jgi:sugar phosphate permease
MISVHDRLNALPIPKKTMNGSRLLKTLQSPLDPTVLARAAAKVKRHVLPLFVVMFIVNYIDRVNIGFVRSHMETDLGIGAAAYGLGAGLFFVGYALFEVPSNMLLQRYGARVWLTRIMFTWGAAAMAMAFVKGETSFYVLRFILGAAEAGFFPGIIYYFTQWLPASSERGKTMAVFPQRFGHCLGDLRSGVRCACCTSAAWVCTAGSGCS